MPDANYTREIPVLASYANVRLLGYVHTSYAQRNISLVRKDIETYAAWPTESTNSDLAVRGIFFDEAPQQYSAQSLTYLQNLTDLVKQLKGFGPNGFVSCKNSLKFDSLIAIAPLYDAPLASPSRFFCFILGLPMPFAWRSRQTLHLLFFWIFLFLGFDVCLCSGLLP